MTSFEIEGKEHSVGTLRKASYKEALIETILDSKIYGLSNIVRVNYPTIRIIWIICFLVSAFFCVYLIGLEFVKFFEHKVGTKISIKYEIPAEFPTVDICNLGELFKIRF